MLKNTKRMTSVSDNRKFLRTKMCFAVLPLLFLLPLIFSAVQLRTVSAEVNGIIELKIENEETAAGDIESGRIDKAERKTLIVLMYHKITKHTKEKYAVTVEQLESDMIELKARGYESVLPSKLIAYCAGKGSLPEKPALITFDDGGYNNHYYGTPILKKHNCKGILNVVGSFSAHSVDSGDHSKPAYSCLTWTQIKEISKEGIFEIGNHSYDMHKFKPRYGIKPKKGETAEAYKTALTADVTRLQNIFMEECGIRPECFAYPFGGYTKSSKEILKELGFKIMLNCYEKPNVITKGKPESLHDINRYNRSGNTTTKSFFDRIEKDVSAMKSK